MKRKGLWSKKDAQGLRFLRLHHDGRLTYEPSHRPAASLPDRAWRLSEADEYAKLVGFTPVGEEGDVGD